MSSKAIPAADKLDAELKHLIASSLGCGLDEITETADFMLDLGADSLDFIEIVMTLEEKFDLAIPDEDAERWQTYGKLHEYMLKRLS